MNGTVVKCLILCNKMKWNKIKLINWNCTLYERNWNGLNVNIKWGTLNCLRANWYSSARFGSIDCIDKKNRVAKTPSNTIINDF